MKKMNFRSMLMLTVMMSLVVSCGGDGDDERKGSERSVNLILSKSSVEIPYMTETSVTLEGIEISDCDVEIEDDWYADAIVKKSTNEVRIIARKVGKTKLIVSYRNVITKCDITVTSFNNYCGDPFLDVFGKTREEIINIHGIPDSSGNDYIVYGDHIYEFKNGVLSYICNFDVRVVVNKNGTILKPSYFAEDAHNSLTERYEYITKTGNIEYFKYKNVCYIASAPGTGKNGFNWQFYYAPSLEEVQDLIN